MWRVGRVDGKGVVRREGGRVRSVGGEGRCVVGG